MRNYLFVLISLLLLTNCELKREAIGAADEITVITSKEHRAPLQNILSAVFTDTIYTPRPEPVYKLNFTNPISYNELKRQTNLIIGSIGTDETNLGTKLVKLLLGDEMFEKTISGNQQIIFSENQFNKNQLFMIISGNNIEEIKSALSGKSEWIKSHFDELFEKKQKKFLFGNDRQNNLTEHFLDKYGWQMQIPWGWEIIKEMPNSNFVWLGRELPYQWFSIHWEPGLVIEDSTEAVTYSKQFPGKYYQSIKYNNYKFSMEPVDFNNWLAWKSQGIWESNDEARGGPFLNYSWYDGVSDRTYNLNILVFIPGKNKATFMRQLDIMAHSFTVK